MPADAAKAIKLLGLTGTEAKVMMNILTKPKALKMLGATKKEAAAALAKEMKGKAKAEAILKALEASGF